MNTYKKRKLSTRTKLLITSCSNDDIGFITVENLAVLLDVNPSYLSRKFKEDTDITLISFITAEKLKRMAANLLNRKEKPDFPELTRKNGFSRSDYLIHIFKENFGIHPGDMRKYAKNSGRRRKNLHPPTLS